LSIIFQNLFPFSPSPPPAQQRGVKASMLLAAAVGATCGRPLKVSVFRNVSLNRRCFRVQPSWRPQVAPTLRRKLSTYICTAAPTRRSPTIGELSRSDLSARRRYASEQPTKSALSESQRGVKASALSAAAVGATCGRPLKVSVFRNVSLNRRCFRVQPSWRPQVAPTLRRKLSTYICTAAPTCRSPTIGELSRSD